MDQVTDDRLTLLEKVAFVVYAVVTTIMTLIPAYEFQSLVAVCLFDFKRPGEVMTLPYAPVAIAAAFVATVVLLKRKAESLTEFVRKSLFLMADIGPAIIGIALALTLVSGIVAANL